MKGFKMGINNEREHNSSWPYDPENPLTAREGEWLPPWRQDETEFRHGLEGYEEIGSENLRHRRPVTTSDLNLKRKIMECLENDSQVDENRIEVKVQEGEVTLSGAVSNHWMKLQIEGWAEQILGVKRIINQIEVNPFPEGH